MKDIIKNEEDVKNKILMPMLKKLGFSEKEVEFEKNFSIRLGTKVHKVNTDKVSGRADILCKVDGKPFFVVEVKGPKIKITEEDIAQGVSYARLLHPIAPFVILSNSKDLKIIETISKNEIQEQELSTKSLNWKDGFQISLKEEQALIFEALEYFLGYSSNNLKSFSLSQIEARVKNLKSTSRGDNKKYIPELIVLPEGLTVHVKRFLESNSCLFLIVGDSGVGKTNVACYLAESLAGEQITLFYDGNFIVESLFEEIKSDFNWVFSSVSEIESIMFKVSNIARKNGKKVVVIIDAVDEITREQIVKELEYFLLQASKFNEIRVIATCKLYELPRFLEVRGTPTRLKEIIFHEKGQKNLNPSNYSYKLEKFEEGQLHEATRRYSQYFGIEGSFSPALREECRTGFMLRIVGEVFSDKALPRSIDNFELLENYLRQVLKKISSDRVEVFLGYLISLAEQFLEEDFRFQTRYDFSP